jgi:hypothetical protein
MRFTPFKGGVGYAGGYNLVTDKTPDCWRIALDGDAPYDVIPHEWKWADVAVALGIFPSKGQAAKNGWGGEFDLGCDSRKTKRHGTIYVTKATDHIIKLHERASRRYA